MLVLGPGAALLALQAGWLDFAADTPHRPVVSRLIEWARERAIARGAAAVVPPADLSAAERIRRGAGNYDAMCVGCHLAPGVAESEIRQGLYPKPKNLAEASPEAGSSAADARRFWIIKHGIKASGMAAWARGGMDDEAIWDLTAFLKALPGLSADAYGRLVAASEGHVHGGRDGHKAAPAGADHAGPEAVPHAHPHGAHRH